MTTGGVSLLHWILSPQGDDAAGGLRGGSSVTNDD